MTDQSMSVLLPPAQDQQVFLVRRREHRQPGSGYPSHRPDQSERRRPEVSSGATAPARHALQRPGEGPANEGKMYVSMVLLPNGNVFETGGGLINRADPVYEASMINTAALEAGDPASTVYTEMAHDPVPRTYHSQSFLLPDGRILSIGNNPANGSFDLRMSVYSPPYMFNGSRPVITSVQSESDWTYANNGGKGYTVTTNVPIKSAELLRPAESPTSPTRTSGSSPCRSAALVTR